MTPRITLSLRPDGELEIHLSPEGRDLLVRALQGLDERNDHVHLLPAECDGEVPLRTIPYNEDDRIIETAKLLFRPREWDERFFPHVLAAETGAAG